MGSVDIKKELEDLELMARNWLRGYKTWITPGDNEYVYEEFKEDIFRHAVPYINRLVETEHIDGDTATKLLQYFLNQIDELRKYAKRYQPGDH